VSYGEFLALAEPSAKLECRLQNSECRISKVMPSVFTSSIEIRCSNEYPHRFGLFGAEGEVRPQYFVYQMLSRMGCELLHLSGPEAEIPLLAARDDQAISAMIINDGRSGDRIVNCEIRHLRSGPKTLTVFRIDEQRRWDTNACELLPVERRSIDFPGETFRMQVWAPRESVSMVRVE